MRYILSQDVSFKTYLVSIAHLSSQCPAPNVCRDVRINRIDIRTYAVRILFESIYFSKLCVKRPFDDLPSSLLSLGQKREPRAGAPD